MRKTEYFIGIDQGQGIHFAVDKAKTQRDEFINNKNIDILDERIQIMPYSSGYWTAIITLAYIELSN